MEGLCSGSGKDIVTKRPLTKICSIRWPGLEMEFLEVGMESAFSQAVRMTNGRKLPVEHVSKSYQLRELSDFKLVAIQGICAHLVLHFDDLAKRYSAHCRLKNIRERKQAFTGMRFSSGLLTPTWLENQELVARVFGSKWREQLESLIFGLQDDEKLYWLEETKNGPLAKKYLSKWGRG